MSKVIAWVGGRKALAYAMAMLVIVIILCGNKWILPADFNRARMIVQESLGAMKWVLSAFVLGNGTVNVARAVMGRTGKAVDVAPPAETPSDVDV